MQTAGIGYTNLTRRYTLERTADIASAASWQAVPGYESIAGNDQIITLTEPAGAPTRFSYRLRVALQ